MELVVFAKPYRSPSRRNSYRNTPGAPGAIRLQAFIISGFFAFGAVAEKAIPPGESRPHKDSLPTTVFEPGLRDGHNHLVRRLPIHNGLNNDFANAHQRLRQLQIELIQTRVLRLRAGI
jgi:hypothetical protein